MLPGNFVSTIEFDKTGDFLACGNRVGRIFVWKKNKDYDENVVGSELYTPQCEFQSHSPEFDYLKSLEIEERIHSVSLRVLGLTLSHCRAGEGPRMF